MLTLTVQHARGQSLRETLTLLRAAWTRYVSGRSALTRHPAVRAYARVVELTWGAHGWHPHLHVIMLTTGPVGGRALVARWLEIVRSLGGHATRAAQDYAVCGPDEALARYLSIAGLAAEASLSASKVPRAGASYTIWQLLELSAGDRAADESRVLLEYASVTAGLRTITYSRSWPTPTVAADADLVAVGDDQAVTLAVIPPDYWRVVVGQDALPELMQLAASGDPDAVAAFLALLGGAPHVDP